MHQKPSEIAVNPSLFDTMFIHRGDLGTFEKDPDPVTRQKAPHKLPEPGPEWEDGINALEQGNMPEDYRESA